MIEGLGTRLPEWIVSQSLSVLNLCSLMPTPRAPPGEKREGGVWGRDYKATETYDTELSYGVTSTTLQVHTLHFLRCSPYR